MFMLIKTFVAQNVDQFSRWNNFTKPVDCNLECRDVYRKTLEVFVAFKKRLNIRQSHMKRSVFKAITNRYNGGNLEILNGKSNIITTIFVKKE